MTHHNPAPKLLQHDIIDPSSPLSILAATSKLTTFPYGELQALNARMNMEASKLNGPAMNGVNGIDDINGLHSVMVGGEDQENGITAMKPLPRQRTRLSMERNNQFKHPATKSLLPSAIPGPIPSTQHTNLNPTPSTSSNIPQTRQVKQRNVTTSAIPRTRTVPISHKRSASLSSTQNTRSSKRIKTSHPAPSAIPLEPFTPPPKPIRAARPVGKSKSQPLPPENKKRILPVRQGQVDILDGEISLLSTPQQLDSTSFHLKHADLDRPSFEPSHKVILIDDSIPSTPTTRYEPFSPSTIPDPNTSPHSTRPSIIPGTQVTIRTLKSVPTPVHDPLPDSLYLKPHRHHELTEIRLRNREREKIDYESSILERQLAILKSEDWRKIVAPAAAEREGLKEGEEWDWEGRRERRIELLDGVLKRVRTWREAEIKMRRGMLEKKTHVDEDEEEPPTIAVKRIRVKTKAHEMGADPKPRHRRTQSNAVEETKGKETKTVREGAEKGKEDDSGKGKRNGRRKRPMAFGQEIPKTGLMNREFQIPLEWVPEDKRI